jgi:sulfotransferase famil protein
MRDIHYLHIGKTAGTQIKNIITQINQTNHNCHITAHPHHIQLRHLKSGYEYFFSIRSPLTRFVSGFYSRKRKGRPRYNREWSDHERRCFTIFQHANELAEALFEDNNAGLQAFSAIKSIEHCAYNQSDFFNSMGFIFEIRQPTAIIRQEFFIEDTRNFCNVLGLDLSVSISDDPMVVHANEYAGCPPLSDKAIRNLREWYRQDFDFYGHCCRWIDVNQNNSPNMPNNET